MVANVLSFWVEIPRDSCAFFFLFFFILHFFLFFCLSFFLFCLSLFLSPKHESSAGVTQHPLHFENPSHWCYFSLLFNLIIFFLRHFILDLFTCVVALLTERLWIPKAVVCFSTLLAKKKKCRRCISSCNLNMGNSEAFSLSNLGVHVAIFISILLVWELPAK